MTFAHVAGVSAEPLTIRVPPSGPWYAEAELESDTPIAGRVDVMVGSVTFKGSVDVHGRFGSRGATRVVAGAGSWASTVTKKHYHSDAGVRTSLVAGDLAREVGETLANSIFPGSERVGIDFVRAKGPASRALRQAIGTASWWVDYAGITQVGRRVPTEVTADYEVLTADPHARTATISVDSVDAIQVGSILRDKLPDPLVVWGLTIRVAAGKVRIEVWGGTDQIGRALVAIAREAFPRHNFMCPYRYRVTDMVASRVRLQAVKAAPGLPDILHVSVLPGLAGGAAVFQSGTLVLVEFIEGDPAQPIVTHFEAEGGAGWLPISVTLDASSSVKIGPSADMVEIGSGTDAPADATGRVVRYGDLVLFPGSGGPAAITLNPGAHAAKVKA